MIVHSELIAKLRRMARDAKGKRRESVEQRSARITVKADRKQSDGGSEQGREGDRKRERKRRRQT